MNDRMQAYLNGELSLDEARVFEAELAQEGAEMEPGVIEDKGVSDAWRALDARERVVKRAVRRRVPVAVWFALAAGLALAIWFAWPRAEPVQIANPKLPPVVIPVHQEADREVVEHGDTVQVATPEVVQEVQIAATDTAPEVAPKVAGTSNDVGAVNGQALVIDMMKTTLGLGPEARVLKDGKLPKAPERYESLRIEAHPQMEALVASGVLDHIVRCIDEGHARRGKFALAVRNAWEKRTRYIEVGGANADQRRCIEAFDPYRSGASGEQIWTYDEGRRLGTSAPFELTLSQANLDLDPEPTLSPGKHPLELQKSPKGKQPSKGKWPSPPVELPYEKGKNPYD